MQSFISHVYYFMYDFLPDMVTVSSLAVRTMIVAGVIATHLNIEIRLSHLFWQGDELRQVKRNPFLTDKTAVDVSVNTYSTLPLHL
jgi:hypothetical protein